MREIKINNNDLDTCCGSLIVIAAVLVFTLKATEKVKEK